MKSRTYLIAAAALSLGLAGLAGCFDGPSDWGPNRQAHEEREFNNGPKHEVCDANGNHCMVCDADNDYCRRLPNNYGPYSQRY